MVSQASLRAQLRLVELEAAGQKIADETPNISLAEAYFIASIYPKLAACTICTDGELPTPDEFLDGLDVEADAWYTAARELNAHWFPVEVSAEADPDEGKKKRRRRK